MKKYRDITFHTVFTGFMLAVFFIPLVSKADTILSSQTDRNATSTTQTLSGGPQSNPLMGNQFFNWDTTNPISIVVIKPAILPQGHYIMQFNAGGVPFSDSTYYDGVSPYLAFYAKAGFDTSQLSCSNNSALSNCNFTIRWIDAPTSGTYDVAFFGTTSPTVVDHQGNPIYHTVGVPYASPLTALWFSVYTGNGFSSLSTSTPLTPQSTFGFSTSTISSFCGQAATTTTSWLSGLANDFSYGICYSFAFLFVPSVGSLNQFAQLQPVLVQKVPFSYVYDIKAIFDSLNASTTANLTALTFNLPDVGSTSPIGTLYPTTFVGLSTSTIGTYLPNGVRISLLDMQRMAFWLTFAFLVYRRIIPHHVMSQTT